MREVRGGGGARFARVWRWGGGTKYGAVLAKSPKYTTPFFFIPSLCFLQGSGHISFSSLPSLYPVLFGPADSSVRIFSAYAQSRRFALKANVRFWYAWNQSFFSSPAKYWASNNFIRYVHYIQVQTRHGNALANCETTSSVFEPKMIFGSMRNIGSKKGAKIPGSLKISIGFPIHCTRGTFCC